MKTIIVYFDRLSEAADFLQAFGGRLRHLRHGYSVTYVDA